MRILETCLAITAFTWAASGWVSWQFLDGGVDAVFMVAMGCFCQLLLMEAR